jgi:hypothetical protein
VCKSCCEKIVKPGKQCVACDGRAKEKDLVELKRDGTGYAAAGGAEAVKVRRLTWFYLFVSSGSSVTFLLNSLYLSL